jgi:glycosyltransferase involved in cell wall biosynthesis
MRITFILPLASMGGGTKVIAIYAQELTARGHDVRLISLPLPRRSLAVKLKSSLKGTGWSRKWSHSSHLDKLKLNHQVLDVWRPIIDTDVPDGDVVIATWWETAEWVNKLSPRKGAKVYFIQHHEVFPYLPERSRETYRLPLHKVVIAQWLRQVMMDEYADHVVDVVPNSGDHSQFFAPVRRKQDRPTVGLLFSTAPEKGMDLSLEALRTLSHKFSDLRIVCFGSERIRRGFDLPNAAEFHFDPAQNDIRKLYAQCDVWLTASSTKGFNLPAMEAMACRTPVVSTRTGWPAEAVKSGWNGMLVDVGADKSQVAQALQWVLVQPEEEWTRLSSNAFQTVAQSSWKASITGRPPGSAVEAA